MQVGLVIGKAIATVKHASLRGQKLLAVQPLLADGRSPDGFPLLAIDTVGAGIGERVLLSSDGKGTREFVQDERSPARWTIIGIEDP